MLLHERLQLLAVRTHERHTVRLIRVGHHAHVVHHRHELDNRLDLVERHVLAAAQLDEVLLAIDDAQVAARQHLADVAGGKVAHAVDVRVVLGRLLGHVVVAERDALAADVDLAARIRLVRRAIAGLGPVGQAHLAARHHAAHRLRVGLIGQLGGAGAARLRQAVGLHERPQAHLHELVHLLAEQSAAGDHDAHLAAEHGAADALEEDAVEEARGRAASEAAQLLLVGLLEERLLEDAGGGELLVDGLAEALEYDGHGDHDGGLEDAQVALLAALDGRRRVGYGLRRRVADRDAVEQAQHLGHQLEHVRQRQVGDDAVLARVEVVQARVDGAHRRQQVAVRHHDALRVARAARRVHDDGEVVLAGRGERDVVRHLGADLLDLAEREHVELEVVGVGLLEVDEELVRVLVGEDDDVLESGHARQYLLQLGQLLAARNGEAALALVDAEGERVHAQRGVQRHDGALDAKAGEGGLQPLGPRLGEHDGVVGARADAELEQAVADVRDARVYLLVGEPLVVAQRELLEHLAVGLLLVVDGDDLAHAHRLLVGELLVDLGELVVQVGLRVVDAYELRAQRGHVRRLGVARVAESAQRGVLVRQRLVVVLVGQEEAEHHVDAADHEQERIENEIHDEQLAKRLGLCSPIAVAVAVAIAAVLRGRHLLCGVVVMIVLVCDAFGGSSECEFWVRFFFFLFV